MTVPRTRNNLPAAFTLIELIVVIGILAVLAAVVVPAAVDSADVQVISGARIVTTDLQYAQDIAITSRVPVTVTFDTVLERYSLTNASGALVHPMTKNAYVVDFASTAGFGRLDVASASFSGRTTVTFDELGSPDSAGSVTLRAGGHVYRVDVAAATGKVTVVAVNP